MYSIIVAIMLGIVSVLEVLLIMGLPIGEFTMGGQYKILPPRLRIMAGVSLIAQFFGMSIALQAGGYLPLWFSQETTRIICYVFAGFFLLNTLMNFCSGSKKERYVMTPCALIAAICFGMAGFQM